MLKRRPFRSAKHVLDAAADVWWNVCERSDWVEAFNGRPLIGDMLSFAKDPWYRAGHLRNGTIQSMIFALIIREIQSSHAGKYTHVLNALYTGV
jgi:hypothetical protein